MSHLYNGKSYKTMEEVSEAMYQHRHSGELLFKTHDGTRGVEIRKLATGEVWVLVELKGSELVLEADDSFGCAANAMRRDRDGKPFEEEIVAKWYPSKGDVV